MCLPLLNLINIMCRSQVFEIVNVKDIGERRQGKMRYFFMSVKQAMTKTLYNVVPPPPVFWYESPEVQIRNFLSLSRRLNLGYSKSDIPEIPRYRILRSSKARLMLAFYLRRKGSKDVYFSTFETLLSYLINIGILELELSGDLELADIRPLLGVEYEAAVKWIFIDITDNVDLSVYNVILSTPLTDTDTLVSVEALMALINFPRLASAMLRGEIPLPNLPGCRIGNKILFIGRKNSGKLVLKDGSQYCAYDSWGSPTIKKIL